MSAPQAPVPEDEEARMRAVAQLRPLASTANSAIEAVAQLASLVTGAPMAVLTIVDGERQWFRASFGRVAGDPSETPRDQSFCAHAIMEPEVPMIVVDASQDPVFAENPAVNREHGVRFYAGVPLSTDGQAVGALCVFDVAPRSMQPGQLEALKLLAEIAERLLEAEARAQN